MISECISNGIPPQMKILSRVIPILMYFCILQASFKLKCCKPHDAACHPTKFDAINDVKLFPTVYHRIYCRKYLMLSYQKLRFKSKCIRMRNKSVHNKKKIEPDHQILVHIGAAKAQKSLHISQFSPEPSLLAQMMATTTI